MRRAAGCSLYGLPSVISYVPLMDGELAGTTFRPLRLHRIYGQIGHPYRIDTTDVSSGKLLRTVFDRWDTSSTTAANGTFVFKAREVTQDYGPSGDHRDKA